MEEMKVLKIALWICGIGCLTVIPFMVLPWAMVENAYRWFGYEPIPAIPTAMYLFRIACGIFGLIGVYFIILAQNPLRYGLMLSLGAYGLISFGLLCLVVGIILKMSPMFYIGEASFPLVLGIIILALSSKAQGMSEEEKKTDINR
ncbi:MAG: hypothetical protein QME07_07785 [bacterium]|nr:hypothetical protein [bacterium]